MYAIRSYYVHVLDNFAAAVSIFESGDGAYVTTYGGYGLSPGLLVITSYSIHYTKLYDSIWFMIFIVLAAVHAGRTHGLDARLGDRFRLGYPGSRQSLYN